MLILDLDQTVLHASVNPNIKDFISLTTHQLHDVQPNPLLSFKDIYSFVLPDKITYYVKLRPFTKQFLSKMHQIYEMHIYTMGSRAYANVSNTLLTNRRANCKDTRSNRRVLQEPHSLQRRVRIARDKDCRTAIPLQYRNVQTIN